MKVQLTIMVFFPEIFSTGFCFSPFTEISCSLPINSHDRCWIAFAKIHNVIRTLRILYVATANVIAEFSQDNVIYLEIRTSPKKIHDIPSKLCYAEAVVKAIK